MTTETQSIYRQMDTMRLELLRANYQVIIDFFSGQDEGQRLSHKSIELKIKAISQELAERMIPSADRPGQTLDGAHPV